MSQGRTAADLEEGNVEILVLLRGLSHPEELRLGPVPQDMKQPLLGSNSPGLLMDSLVRGGPSHLINWPWISNLLHVNKLLRHPGTNLPFPPGILPCSADKGGPGIHWELTPKLRQCLWVVFVGKLCLL